MRNRSTLLLALVLTVACSTNPATGKKEFNIVSEQQELAIGQQSHEQVVKQFGVVHSGWSTGNGSGSNTSR